MPSSKPILGINDLQSQFPEIAGEAYGWDPETVRKGSQKKVWWQCNNHPDHKWDAVINDRTGKGQGCPICAGNKILIGFNDLQTLEPKIAKEWHPTRNGDLKPIEVARSSNKKIWWKCNKHPDHEWDAKIADRSNGSGCPFCAGHKVLAGFNDLESKYPGIAAEAYDWNPKTVTAVSGRKKQWKGQCGHIWCASISSRISGTGCPICVGKQVLEGFNDLQTLEPKIAKEWHPTRNGDLKPIEVARSSNKKIWWKCNKHPDHEWQARIADRSFGKGCPVCKGLKVLKGFNDLQTLEPEIATEWHPTRNGDLKPTEVARSSDKKVWWQCSKHPGHEWDAIVKSRSDGRGCPICCEYGFSTVEDAWFYLMQRPGEQQFGITNNLQDRIKSHERNGWTLIEHTSFPSNGQIIFHTEKAFKQWLKKEIGLVKGTTENWSTTLMEVQSLAELKARSGIETDLF
jgi:hypothetical protein